MFLYYGCVFGTETVAGLLRKERLGRPNRKSTVN